MILSIIIVSYNTKELLEQCLESITGSFQNQVQSPKLKVKSLNGQPLSLSDLEIIIVDNTRLNLPLAFRVLFVHGSWSVIGGLPKAKVQS